MSPTGKPEDAIDRAIGKTTEAPETLSHQPLLPADNMTAVAALTRDPSKSIVISLPPDFEAGDTFVIFEMLLKMVGALEAKRASEAHSGLIVPERPRIVRPS